VLLAVDVFELGWVGEPDGRDECAEMGCGVICCRCCSLAATTVATLIPLDSLAVDFLQ
jgi:hypothetical protein